MYLEFSLVTSSPVKKPNRNDPKKVTCSKRKEKGCKQVPEVCIWNGTKCNSLVTTSSPVKKPTRTDLEKKVTCSKRKEKGCKQVPEVCIWDGTKCNSLVTSSHVKKPTRTHIAPDLHAILTKYFNASQKNYTKKYVRVIFTDIDNPLDIWLDKNKSLWYIFEDPKDGDHQLIKSSHRTYEADCLWNVIEPIGDKTIDESKISRNFNRQESVSGSFTKIRKIKNRSIIVRNIINNTNIASVHLYGTDKLPIQNLEYTKHSYHTPQKPENIIGKIMIEDMIQHIIDERLENNGRMVMIFVDNHRLDIYATPKNNDRIFIVIDDGDSGSFTLMGRKVFNVYKYPTVKDVMVALTRLSKFKTLDNDYEDNVSLTTRRADTRLTGKDYKNNVKLINKLAKAAIDGTYTKIKLH